MSCYSDKVAIYSHPDKLLKDHLQRVLNTGIKMFNDKRALELPYDIPDTEIILKYILLFHDAGKMTGYFQEYLFKKEGYQLLQHQGLTNHGLISALVTAYQVSRYFDSNKHNLLYTAMAFAAVRKHHGNLENYEDMLFVSRNEFKKIDRQIRYCNPGFFKKHFSNIVKVFDFDLAELKMTADSLESFKWDLVDNSSIEDFLYFNFIYSVLLYSDKHEAIFSKEGTPLKQQIRTDIVDRFKIDNFGNNKNKSGLDMTRDNIYKDINKSIEMLKADDRIFSINVPTGSGKTISSLNAALKLRDENQQRIIYCLPFTSVIDQNADVFDRILSIDFKKVSSNLLLKHHHLVENSWIDEKQEFSGDEAEFMIETWNSELVVTTFWQFFHTLFSHKNSHLKKFHHMSNSVIILDEIQAVPVKYWTLINRVLKKFVYMFNCKIILVTATLPMIFSEKQGEIKELVSRKESYFKSLDRIKLSIDSSRMDIDSFSEKFIRMIEKDKRYLVILNTIQSSLDFYHRLKEFNPIYLSTNIIPKHRLEKIDYIKRKNEGDILVSTQLVEAGVDIDFDFVYRDNAPLDCINQGAGRCNRENRMNRKGEVILVKLENNGRLYSSYIYDQLLLNTTDEILKDQDVVFENRFFDIARLYFSKVSNIISNRESADILEKIKQLKYEDAFSGKEAFRLIENSFERENVFVEADEEAQQIWDIYTKIKSIKDRWQRKIEFNEIKSKFSQYIITVSRESLKKNPPPEDNGLYRIPFDQLGEYYDMDTGFKLEGGTAIW